MTTKHDSFYRLANYATEFFILSTVLRFAIRRILTIDFLFLLHQIHEVEEQNCVSSY
jgi:hypothetical protein